MHRRRLEKQNWKQIRNIWIKKICALVVLACVGWQIYPPELTEKSILIQKNFFDNLSIKNIEVSGNKLLDKEAIISKSGILISSEITEIDTNSIKKNLEECPQIDSASVKLQIPNTIKVSISERSPAALWKIDKKIFLIDINGNALKEIAIYDEYENLLTIEGQNANIKLKDILEYIQNSILLSQIKKIQFVGKRRWNIVFKDDMIAKLPEHNVREAVLHLENLLLEENSNKELKVIDLRFIPEKIYIKFKD